MREQSTLGRRHAHRCLKATQARAFRPTAVSNAVCITRYIIHRNLNCTGFCRGNNHIWFPCQLVASWPMSRLYSTNKQTPPLSYQLIVTHTCRLMFNLTGAFTTTTTAKKIKGLVCSPRARRHSAHAVVLRAACFDLVVANLGGLTARAHKNNTHTHTSSSAEHTIHSINIVVLILIY